MPGSKPGERRGGRKKGTPNKISRALKEDILDAARLAGGKEGVVGYLKEQATANPGPFMSLLGKVLPLQVTGEGGDAIRLKVERIERVVIDPANSDT